jgi:voltage-gated potassium channel
MTVTVVLVRLFRRLRQQKGLGVGLVLLLVAVSIVGNALCFWIFDGPGAGVGLVDALWYSIISITTIGYGDYSASSPGARIGTIVFIVGLGLTTFTIFLGMVIDWTTNLALKGRLGMGSAVACDHVLIVNFPSASRVRSLIEELQADRDYPGCEIVVVTDRIESLPFEVANVVFINGSPLEEETYRRAGIDRARLAIVLATAADDSASDAVVSSAVSVIENIRPDLRTVAECLDRRHEVLFDAVNCDAIVCGQTIVDRLLAHEGYDPGVARMIESLTSSAVGETLFSTQAESSSQVTYRELSRRLLERGVRLLCIDRGGQAHLTDGDLHPEKGDLVIYVARARLDWTSFLG